MSNSISIALSVHIWFIYFHLFSFSIILLFHVISCHTQAVVQQLFVRTYTIYYYYSTICFLNDLFFYLNGILWFGNKNLYNNFSAYNHILCSNVISLIFILCRFNGLTVNPIMWHYFYHYFACWCSFLVEVVSFFIYLFFVHLSFRILFVNG